MKLIALLCPIILSACSANTHSGFFFEVDTMAKTPDLISIPLYATRNDSNDADYPGHGYSDSKAAAEDAHYHSDPEAYNGKP